MYETQSTGGKGHAAGPDPAKLQGVIVIVIVVISVIVVPLPRLTPTRLVSESAGRPVRLIC
jgi:hypothetical protein